MKSSRPLVCAFSLGAIVAGGCHGSENEAVSVSDNGAFQGIVGGEETGYDTFQGVVGLYLSLNAVSGALCTATLIDPQVLLTAGHCVYYPSEGIDAIANLDDLTVLGGANINTAGGVEWQEGAAEVVKHPSWTGELGFSATDLAMVKLAAPVTEVESYRLRRTDDVAGGDTGVIVGYGLLETAQPNSSGIHRFGETTVQNKVMHYLNLGDPTGTCQGDSGGPFFTQMGGDGHWYLTGVTSLGLSEECSATNGSVDENVALQIDWIEETMMAFVGHGLDDVEYNDTDTGPDADADADADSDTDADADTDSDTDADSDTDTDADTDANADTDADAGTDADADTDTEIPGHKSSDSSCSAHPAPARGTLGLLGILQ